MLTDQTTIIAPDTTENLRTHSVGMHPEYKLSFVSKIDHLRRDQIRREEQADSPTEIGTVSHLPHFAGFFLTVFVFGQIMSQWALYSGHYAAWIAGLLFSILGISITLGSLVATLKERQRTTASVPEKRYSASQEESINSEICLVPKARYTIPDSSKATA